MPSSSLPLAIAIVLCSSASVARADQVTLAITGRVLPGTCTLVAPAIALDPIRVDELAPGDNKLKAGTLEFIGCVGVSKAVLSFDGAAATGDPERWENTATTDAAAGVSVALLAGATGSSYLKKGDTGIDIPVTGTTASYALRAGYYATSVGAARQGEVRAEITVTADYQ